METDLNNKAAQPDERHASGCNSICPECKNLHNDCILKVDHVNQHECNHGHHWV